MFRQALQRLVSSAPEALLRARGLAVIVLRVTFVEYLYSCLIEAANGAKQRCISGAAARVSSVITDLGNLVLYICR